MNSTVTTNLIIDTVGTFGTAVLAILGSVVIIGLGMLVFYRGWEGIRWSTGERGIWVGDRFYGSSHGKLGITKSSF